MSSFRIINIYLLSILSIKVDYHLFIIKYQILNGYQLKYHLFAIICKILNVQLLKCIINVL